MTETLALQQLMSASLYRDDAQLDSFTKTLVREFVARAGRVAVGDPRVAYTFGRIEHDHPGNPDTQDVACTEACEVVGCDEPDAAVVMMRVEVDVEAVPGG